MSPFADAFYSDHPLPNSKAPQRLITGFGVVFAGVLAALMLLSARWPYAYSDADNIAMLYAQGFFHSQGELNTLVPYSQIHFPIAFIVWLAKRLGPFCGALLWAAQSLVAYWMIGNLYPLAKRLLPFYQALIVIGIALVHPAVWSALLFAPSHAVTAWLALASMNRIMDDAGKGAMTKRAAFTLFALSFCGANGVFWAVAIALYGAVILIQKNQPIIAGLILLPLAPALLMNIVLTLAWGVWGGPVIANIPMLWQNLGCTFLMNGLWTQHVQSALRLLGLGGVLLPAPFMLIGVFAILGAVSANDSRLTFGRFALIACVIHIMLGAFSPPDDYQTFTLISILLMAPFVVMGIAWLSQSLRMPLALPVTLAVYGLTLLLSMYFVLQPHWEQARFYQYIADETKSVIDEHGDGAALQFTSAVFAHLSANENIQPIGVHWRLQYEKNFIPAAPPTIAAALQSSFAWIGFYSPFSEAQSNLLDSPQAPLLEPVNNDYTKERRGNLIVWLQNEAPPESPLEQDAGASVGYVWDFENGFAHTKRIGAAFGLEPDVSQSAVGFACAGPGADGAEWLLGSITSEPFTIEGDELRFYADIPKSSTQAFFALAVKDEAPWDVNAKIKQTAHLYDRKPGEILMGNAFVYIEPSQLAYTENSVSGWRVVRAAQSNPQGGWRQYRWALDPWIGQQAMWLAADRDPHASFRIDQVQQWKRAPGRYWNFEAGTYAGWQAEGEAFGDGPAIKALGAQTSVSGFEGNYFVNSFYQGSDAAVGRLLTEPFVVEFNHLSFLVGGGDDAQRVFVGLDVNGEYAIRASGERSETLRRVEWDLSPWKGQSARIVIEDQSPGAWGHILADDFRLTN
ncbi:hypothetical protein K8I31_14155 [bacterium]|nr:hypothetical protein [bacterium]